MGKTPIDEIFVSTIGSIDSPKLFRASPSRKQRWRYSCVNRNGQMSMDIELTALLRALAISEAGSYAAAARVLGVSRQAIHRSVAALEEQAGGAVFDTGSRQLRPTSLGRELLECARQIRVLQQKVAATVARSLAGPSGTLRVTGPPLLGDVVLAPTILEFARQWPEVRIHVSFEPRRTDLVRDDIDLMVRVGSAPPEEHFAVRLGQAAIVLCASPWYLDTVGEPQIPQSLSEHRLLEYGPRASGLWRLKRAGEEAEVGVNVSLVADSARVLVETCAAGHGILRVPAMAVAEELRAGTLRRVLQDWTVPGADVWAVYGHRTSDDPTLAAFIGVLRHVFEGRNAKGGAGENPVMLEVADALGVREGRRRSR